MPKLPALSSFAERFEFSRDRQRVLGTWEKDEVLATAIGVSAASITDYKSRDVAPPADRTLAIAKWVGVDPGWLAFGEETGAPAPEGFATWLEKRRAPRGPVKAGAILPVTRNPAAVTSEAARRRRPGSK